MSTVFPGIPRGYVSELVDSFTLRILSDREGGVAAVLRVDLETGEVIERRGEFSPLEQQLVPLTIANAKAAFLGLAAPNWRAFAPEQEIGHIYRYDTYKPDSSAEYQRYRAKRIADLKAAEEAAEKSSRRQSAAG